MIDVSDAQSEDLYLVMFVRRAGLCSTNDNFAAKASKLSKS